jgi:hypothetical protein
MTTTIDLQPTWTRHDLSRAYQIEALEELHRLASEGPAGRFMLGERFVALAMHPTLSRADMARVSGLSEAEVYQIIQERVEHQRYCDNRAAEARVARHLPV